MLYFFLYSRNVDFGFFLVGINITRNVEVVVISKVAPENAIIMGDAGSHMLWLSEYLNLTGNQRYQNPGSFGPMASHTNGCIGVKCANPDKVVISGSGDGCYLMAGFELLTAVQNDIPVIWVIFNNGEFNVIKKRRRTEQYVVPLLKRSDGAEKDPNRSITSNKEVST